MDGLEGRGDKGDIARGAEGQQSVLPSLPLPASARRQPLCREGYRTLLTPWSIPWSNR